MNFRLNDSPTLTHSRQVEAVEASCDKFIFHAVIELLQSATISTACNNKKRNFICPNTDLKFKQIILEKSKCVCFDSLRVVHFTTV